MTRDIWIWQNVLSPHMAALAKALAERGHRVRYIAQKLSLAERTELGWTVPELDEVELVHCPSRNELIRLAQTAGPEVEHIFQGFRGNGLLAYAYRTLGRQNAPFWVFLETVDDRGVRGMARRAYYRLLFWRWRSSLRGVLAVGAKMSAWVVARGIDQARVHPFTYFLPEDSILPAPARQDEDTVRLMFVGKLIERKGVDVLLHAIASARLGRNEICLSIVGSGPEDQALKALAERLGLNENVRWLGSRPIEEIPLLMATADLFVLPSRFDGWGAVVTEALMAGTPAIATDMCGAAEAVRASGCGAVVRAGDPAELSSVISSAVARGPVSPDFRSCLANWALVFGAKKGALHLVALFESSAMQTKPPLPPWLSHAPPRRNS